MTSRLSALFLLFSFSTVCQAGLDGSKYPRVQHVHEDYILRWKVDDDRIHIGIVANATGWVGFGISEAGGMKGADIVYFLADGNKLVDAHSFDYQPPQPDVCQDWTLLEGSVQDGKIVLEAFRQLDTGDEQDWKIVNDEKTALGHYFIAAWGNTAQIAYHAKSRAKGRVFLFGDAPVDKRALMMQTPGLKRAELLRETKFDQPLPAEKNYYDLWCINLAGAMGMDGSTPVHVVGYEPNLWPATEQYVHHFLVFSYLEEDCKGETGGISMNWGPGMYLTQMPDVAGIRFFGEGGYKSLQFQTHYNNPKQVAGLKDKSGLTIFYTPELRRHDVGVLQIGDPHIRLFGRSVPRGWSKQAFRCTGLTDNFDEDKIFVFMQYLHMHGTGQRIEQRVLRGKEVVRRDTVDMYEFEQNGGIDPLSTDDGFHILKGDNFELDCFFNVPKGHSRPKWGMGSEDEMCLTYLTYYPKQKHLDNAGACDIPFHDDGTDRGHGAFLGQTMFDSEHDAGRRFGVACDGSNVKVSLLAPSRIRVVLLGCCSLLLLGLAWASRKRLNFNLDAPAASPGHDGLAARFSPESSGLLTMEAGYSDEEEDDPAHCAHRKQVH